MQMKTLDIKSQIIEKDGQINDLMENLATKGEETAHIHSQYLELKNYILETKYSITRVPITEIVQSPNLKAVLASPQAPKRLKTNVQRKNLVFSFLQDKEL